MSEPAGPLENYYADLHIHVGYSSSGKAIKMACAKNLTVENILHECQNRKGIQIVGLADCLAPAVQADLASLIAGGDLREMDGGGLCWQEAVTLLPGAELETRENDGCRAHCLVLFPNLRSVRECGDYLRRFIRNIDVSALHCQLRAAELLEIGEAYGAVFIPAHIFTPHKGLLGACTDRLSQVFPGSTGSKVSAVELGLSADTDLADTIDELASCTFLSNSDAHSLPKIGREYNVLSLAAPNFAEVVLAFHRQEGRRVAANYGLDPALGKYHRTFCLACGAVAQAPPPVDTCPACGGDRVVLGVLDRIVAIRDRETPIHPSHRPPYRHQVPLEFLPGVGPQTLDRLIERFGSEMAVLHHVPYDELTRVISAPLAAMIVRARTEDLAVNPGGGGRYGILRQD